MSSSLKNEETIFPNIARMRISTAMSTVFTFITDSLNSVFMRIIERYTWNLMTSNPKI